MAPSTKKIVGVTLSIASGLCYGCNFLPPQYLVDHHAEGHSDDLVSYILSHFTGILGMTLLFFIAYCWCAYRLLEVKLQLPSISPHARLTATCATRPLSIRTRCFPDYYAGCCGRLLKSRASTRARTWIRLWHFRFSRPGPGSCSFYAPAPSPEFCNLFLTPCLRLVLQWRGVGHFLFRRNTRHQEPDCGRPRLLHDDRRRSVHCPVEAVDI